MAAATHAAELEPTPLARTWGLLLLAAAILGAWLRLDQFGAQLAADDEWHSIHAVRDESLGWILSRFGVCDHGIPMSALDWILARLVGLSEAGMRALPLAAGIAAVPLLAWLLRRHVGEPASLWFAFLLAISPLEVFYSRFARPYEPVFLLAALSLLSLLRWLAGGARAWAWIYAVTAALSIWFHLVTLPFVAAPLVWGLRPGGAGERGRAALVRLGLLTATGMAALLLPPLLADLDTLRARAVGHAQGWPDGEACFQLLSGTSRLLPSFVFGLALLCGLVTLRRMRELAGWLLVPALAQFALPLLARPAMLQDPTVLVRYVIPAHFVWLVLAALGLQRLDGLARAEFARLPRGVLPAALITLLHFGGPLPRIHARPNGWTHHQAFQASYVPNFAYSYARDHFGPAPVPPVYAELGRAARPGELLLEAPWYAASGASAYPLHQRVHRMQLLVGFVTPEDAPLPLGEVRPDDPRFRFANFAHVSRLDDLRACHVRFVVFHRKPPRQHADPRYADLRHVEHWIERYRELVGPPRFEDESLCVFDLAP